MSATLIHFSNFVSDAFSLSLSTLGSKAGTAAVATELVSGSMLFYENEKIEYEQQQIQ